MSEATGSAAAGTPAGNAAGNDGGQQGNAATGGTPPAAASGNWYDSIQSEDLRGFAQNRGWQDVGQVVESFRNAEKLLGVPKDQLLRMPQGDDAQAWDAFYEKIGRPAKPDGYKLPVPDGDTGEFAKVASNWFHKAGLNTKQAEGLATEWNAYMTQVLADQDAAQSAQSERELGDLRKEWGNAYDSRVELGRRAAREFGVEGETLTAMENAVGTAKLLKLFANIGEKFGESSFVEGSQGGQNSMMTMTPTAAKAKYDELRRNPEWVAKALTPGTREHEEKKRIDAALST